ncbi:hypothetical protein FPSE_03971 [Fusarium pseudograminearum CS3096]|uniref:Uncharacterized protein n=1 Tax=Fusarium pseudograminearum (strain CS3096) TaxID=1028729 RepID=K3UTJ9_FUSPC|nr:hypothetical protein FPSE_03971 [Fusarium pseudograminearum CS3096]EKJ75791.1 hypothetical protein FPSE_03971 [Fusarium pseudograminearum CS3096]KAF0642243.1 hypothetical protein FPSE5266_03971 [Fusarium pseudograminearum]
MDLLSGVGGCCSSTDKVESVASRDSSISLDDGAYKRYTPERVKSPFSFDLGIFDEPSLHGPTLPTPSIASSPSVVAPMDVYLRCNESHESRMMRLSGTASQQYKHTELKDISPAGTCSWEFVSAQIPNTPVLQPALTPKPTANSSHTSGNKNIFSGSDMSELALSVDSQPMGDDTERYEEAIAEYKAASKRYKYEFLFL